MFNYVTYGNLEIMYVWTGMWSTVFGVVTGVIGIKASNQPIFKLKKIDHLHRSFTQMVSLPTLAYRTLYKVYGRQLRFFRQN